MDKSPTYEDLLDQNRILKDKIANTEAFHRIYDLAWNSSIFGVIRVNEAGIINDISPNGAHLFAKPSLQLVNTIFWEQFNPNEQDELSAITHSIIKDRNKIKAKEFHILPPASKTVMLSIEFIEYPEEKPSALVVLRDVTDQNNYAEELNEKEFFLNQAQKIANFGHYILDIPTSTWDASAELLRIMGITNNVKTEIDLWIALIHPDDRHQMSDYLLNHVIKGKNTFNKEYRIVRPTDGETIWVHGKGELRFNEQGKPVKMIGTIHDISDRKLSEEMLKKSKALYQDLVETSQNLIWQCDIKGNFVFVNSTFINTLGYSLNEIIGHHFSKFTSVKQREEDITQFSNILRNGQVNNYESILINKNGTPVFISLNAKTITNEQGKLTGVRGTARDITEIKKSDQLIREKSEELDRFFSTALDLLCVADKEGRFIRINPEWEKVLGYKTDEILNKRFLDFVHPDDISSTIEITNQLIQGKEALNFTNRYLCKDGSYKFIEWRSAMEGNIIYAAARDVSQRIELEDNLIQSNKDLKEINVQKDKFIYIIAHDLRNPLHNIISISDLLNLHFKDNNPEDNHKLIQLLAESTHSMYELIENLLNWALSQTGKLTIHPSVIPLGELTQKTINQVLPIATAKNIEFINKVPKNINAWADETMMSTVLRNLLSNAIKFSHHDSRVELFCNRNSKTVILEIKDYGIGINPQFVEGLFLLENAYLKKGTSGEKGTGFGLPLCRELMKKQSGNIWATSNPNKGSSFFVEIPLSNK